MNNGTLKTATMVRGDVLRPNEGNNPWQEKNQLITSIDWISLVPDAGKIRKFFPKRGVQTVPFQIDNHEWDFYDSLTRYVEDQSIKAEAANAVTARALPAWKRRRCFPKGGRLGLFS